MLQGLDFSWHWNPIIVISLLLLCLLYVVAIRLAHRYKPEETLPSYRIIAFASAIILIALVLLTPLDTIARTQLFAAHMIQAVTLTTLCAPLLLAACPDWLLQPLIDQPVHLRESGQIWKPRRKPDTVYRVFSRAIKISNFAGRDVGMRRHLIQIEREFRIEAGWNFHHPRIRFVAPMPPRLGQSLANRIAQPIDGTTRFGALLQQCDRIKINGNGGIVRREFDDPGFRWESLWRDVPWGNFQIDPQRQFPIHQYVQ